MRAEVIAIGDEITSGQRLDTNSQWLSERLTELGIEVAFHTTVGDQLEDNVTVFIAAIERADVVVATGGLGPTADDLTREALVRATGRELVRDPAALAHIEELFANRGRTMPERNRVQADFPAGSRPIHNEHGTAPGIEMVVERPGRGPCVLFALPGVPAEMHQMWLQTVALRLGELQPAASVIRHRRIKCFGMGESQLEAMLPDLIRRGREPKVGITASDATITLRITATAATEAACFQAAEPTVAIIRQALGNLVFGEEDDELEHVVVRMLNQHGLTLAVAEMATAGRITERLVAVDSESKCFLGGMVVASQQQLNRLLDAKSLPEGMPLESATVAVKLAEHVRQQFGAEIGLAVAAYPADPFQANAHACAAIATANRTRKVRFDCASHPAILHIRTVKQALNALRLELLSS